MVFVFHDKFFHSDFLSNQEIKIKSEPARLLKQTQLYYRDSAKFLNLFPKTASFRVLWKLCGTSVEVMWI